MRYSLMIILFFSLVMTSCEEGLTQQEELEQMNDLFNRMRSMAVSVDCSTTDMNEWRVTPIGTKACGGPIGYMPYHPSIDTTTFLKLVESHRIAQNNYNFKYGIISDCSIPSYPSGVGCEETEPILLFE